MGYLLLNCRLLVIGVTGWPSLLSSLSAGLACAGGEVPLKMDCQSPIKPSLGFRDGEF